jgi:6-phosphofructokinase 1
VHKGEFGKMVALRGNEIVAVPLADAVNVNRTVDEKLIAVAESLQEEPNHRPQNTGKKG